MRKMGYYYERWVRPALFRLDPEKAHEWAVDSLAMLGAFSPLRRALEALVSPPGAALRPSAHSG